MAIRFGYTLMTEQAGPRQLVRDAVSAEAAGFDFEYPATTTLPGCRRRDTRLTRGQCSVPSRTRPSASG